VEIVRFIISAACGIVLFVFIQRMRGGIKRTGISRPQPRVSMSILNKFGTEEARLRRRGAIVEDEEKKLQRWQSQYPNDSLKMVICIRNDIEMKKGKMCAQAAHGAVGVTLNLLTDEDLAPLFYEWSEQAQAKIVLRVDSEDELMKVQTDAESKGLPTYLVVDAGRTQIAPNTKTVVAIGPGPTTLIDQITGQLKLM